MAIKKSVIQVNKKKSTVEKPKTVEQAIEDLQKSRGPISEELKHSLSEPLLSASQEHENRVKYGSREDDTIARAYRHSKEGGDIYCSFTAQKYITRFLSPSRKGSNSMDLRKAIDYLQRMIDKNVAGEEVIEK